MTFQHPSIGIELLAGAAVAAALSLPAAGENAGCAAVTIAAGYGADRTAEVPAPVAEAIWGWVARRMQVDPALGPPPVCVVPQAELERIQAEAHGVAGPLTLVAMYHREASQIFLSAPWDPRDPVAQSALAHELAHHAQSVSGRRFACPQDAEAEPYALQQEWLGAFGSDLKSAYGIDRLTLFVLTVCGM